MWLTRAFDDRSFLLTVYLTTNARLDALHAGPRFGELRRRLKLPNLGKRDESN